MRRGEDIQVVENFGYSAPPDPLAGFKGAYA